MKKQIVRKIKKVLAVLTGAVFISFMSDISVTKAEGKVDLSIETREININDIPSDRKVPVAVNLDNDPGIRGILIVIMADSGLGIEDMFTWCDSPHRVSICDYQSSPHIDLCDIIMNEQDNNSGNLINLYYSIPEDCRPGDFYEIAFYGEKIMNDQICYADSEYNWHFGTESFGRLTSGGIRITGDVPAPEPQVQNPEPVQNVQQPESPAADVPLAASSQNIADTEKTETSDTTVTVSETKAAVSAVSTVDTIKNPVTTDELFIAECSENTETGLSEETDSKENNNKDYLVYIMIIAGVAVIAAGVIIIGNRKKK